MDSSTYSSLMEMVKLIKKEKITFPENKNQNFHDLHDADSESKEFELLINRKGHLRDDVLTYQMKSKENGLLVRLDMTGPSHDDRDGNPIDTPQVHIFNEEHNQGRWAVPISEIIDTPIINILHDSLVSFLLYNKVELKNTQISII